MIENRPAGIGEVRQAHIDHFKKQVIRSDGLLFLRWQGGPLP